MSIRIGIFGYGNLARGVEAAIGQNPDMTLVAVFTRRDPSTIVTKTGVPVYGHEEAIKMAQNNVNSSAQEAKESEKSQIRT